MIELKIGFTKKQKEALTAFKQGVKYLFYGGARGGGKSKFGRNLFFLNAMKYPKSRYTIIRKTHGDLVKNHVDKFKIEFPENLYHYNKQDNRIEFINGSIIEFSYLQYANDVERYHGVEYDGIMVDEIQQHDVARVLPQLKGSLRSVIPDVQPIMLLTGMPGGVGHAELKKTFITPSLSGRLDSKYAFVQAKSSDNPYIDKGYQDVLDSLPEKLRRAWRDGDWDIFEGQFFSEFGIHLRESPFHIQPHEANIYGSMDYGEGSHATSGATSYNHWHIDTNKIPHLLFTYYRRNQTAATYAREIVDAIKSFPYTQGVMPKQIYADPSMFIARRMDEAHTQSVADIFKQYDLPLVRANNDRINGWRVMRQYFTSIDGISQSKYFDGWNQEYEDYIPTLMHDDRRPEDVEKGGEDHVGDSARYGFVAFMGLKSDSAIKKKKKRTSVSSVIANWNYQHSGEYAPCGV